MPIKVREFRAPWAATYPVSKTVVQNYSGDARVSRDSLDVSVSTNRGGENPFSSSHVTLEGSIGYCPRPPTGIGSKYFTHPGPSSWGNMSLPEADNVSWDAANIWARSNPSRPAVLLPVFWLELREIPDMIRQAGRFLLHARNWRRYVRKDSQTRDLATANLAFQFGWAPLVGDLWKIATFQDAVDKRRKLIDKLYSGKGLRRTGKLGSTSKTFQGSGNANFGSYRNFYVSYLGLATKQSWFVAKWKPTQPSALPPSDGALRAHLTGVHPSHILENVWEALPWSWLIDYFTNIGDVIQAGNNYLATPAGGSVMTTSTSAASHPASQQGLDALSAGTVRFIRRSRAPLGGASLTASLPNLEAGQLSILGSLAVLKGRKTLGT